MGIFDRLFGKKVTYNDISEKNKITFYRGKKYTGIVQYIGNSEAEFLDGEIIKKHTYFDDGSLKNLYEVVNGKLIETKGWIKIDKDGNYNEKGKKILVREYKEGKKINYGNTGKIEREQDLNTSKTNSETDSLDTFTNLEYYENGILRRREVKTKFEPDGKSGGDTIEFTFYYESGELKEEKVEDEKFMTKYISYYKNKKIKSITVSKTKHKYQGHTFEFDENGKETTVRFNEELKGEESIREYLELGEFKGIVKSKPKEREILSHEIMTKGVFMFETNDGKEISIFGQRHTLASETQLWNEEIEEWEEGDREEIEDFHLTEYENGYRFSEDDLYKHFEIEEYPEWDYNGFSNDWCGIEEDDSYEERQKKWDDYKQKFPELKSIDQFKMP